MELADRLHLVASGFLGLSLTDEYDCNAYLVDGGDELALVDTGAGYRVDLLLERITELGYATERIRHVLLTHKHADHAGGAAAVVRESDAEVIATAVTAEAVRDADGFNRRLDRARRSGAYPEDYVFEGVTVNRIVRGEDIIAVGDLSLRVIDTPGHCAGHCAFELSVDGSVVLFSGDAVLPFGQIVLQPIPDCSLAESVASVETLSKIETDMLLAGHLAPVLRDGRRHVRYAMRRVEQGRVPDELNIPGR